MGEMLSQAAWRELIKEQEGGTQSIAAFCQKRGIKEHRFYRQKRRLRESQSGLGFDELTLSPKGSIGIVIGGGIGRIEVEAGFNAELLREVVEALR